MELKEIVKNHLVEEKETARLKRVEANKNLTEVTIYVSKQQEKLCKSYIDSLKSEGIKFIEKDIEEDMIEWDKIISITNYNSVPLVKINNNYFVFKRDFQNLQQFIQVITFFAKPHLINEADNRLFEHVKTNTANLHLRLNQLEGKLNPIMNFLTDLKKQLTEEDSE